MPQVQANQVVPGQGGAPKLYGVDKPQNSVPFQERMMKLFRPQEFVTIRNITDERLYWQYMPQDKETENQTEDGMQRMIYREQPEMWYLDAGATDVLVGASAYRALDVMYKNYAANSTLRKFNDPNSQLYDEKGQHLPRNFNFADGGAQDAFLELAFLGKATPTFGMAPEDREDSVQQPVNDAPADQPADQPAAPATPQTASTDTTYANPDDTTAKTGKELANAGKNSK